jgi:hypothetical protein
MRQAPVNVVHYDQATLGERVADKVAGVIVSIWLILNRGQQVTGFAICHCRSKRRGILPIGLLV